MNHGFCKMFLYLQTCVEGWVYYNNSCYEINTRPAAWSLARDDCKSKQGHLATIANEGENVFVANLKNHVDQMFQHAAYWIGLKMQFTATDNSSSVSWENQEPFTGYSKITYTDGHACFVIKDGVWQTFHCTVGLFYVCEKMYREY